MTSLDDRDLATYRCDGAVCLRGVVSPDWVGRLRDGVAANLAEPGPYAQHYTPAENAGAYFGDYCNWRRIPAFRDFALVPEIGRLAAALMESERVQFFHEHVLVKAGGTAEATPWHHDQPYYVMQGRQVLSLWVALDPVPRAVCPRFVAGSHRWGKLFYPRRFKDGTDYDYAGPEFETLPPIDENQALRAWTLMPGDAIAFHFLTVHDAPSNPTAEARRAISFRWLGDDAAYVDRPGTPSPPYPDMGLRQRPGEPPRADWFPVVWPPEQRSTIPEMA